MINIVWMMLSSCFVIIWEWDFVLRVDSFDHEVVIVFLERYLSWLISYLSFVYTQFKLFNWKVFNCLIVSGVIHLSRLHSIDWILLINSQMWTLVSKWLNIFCIAFWRWMVGDNNQDALYNLIYYSVIDKPLFHSLNWIKFYNLHKFLYINDNHTQFLKFWWEAITYGVQLRRTWDNHPFQTTDDWS